MSEHDRLAELAKRRGFFFPASEVYGGSAGFYVYGPTGAALKRNLESSWRDRFTVREDNMEIDAPTVMPEAVFDASGHLDGFDDVLIECADCGTSHRADHLLEDAAGIPDAERLDTDAIADLFVEHDLACPTCGAPLAGEPVEEFNLMFGTNIGPGSSAPGYLRPETAQGIFVEFPRLKAYARDRLPFGVTQIGPAYRNEISPRRGLVRLREFTQAELELFIDPARDDPPLERIADVTVPLYPIAAQRSEDGAIVRTSIGEAVDSGLLPNRWIAYYLGVGHRWYERIGIDGDRFRYRQHRPGERAHYAADCWDAEVEIGGDWIEVTGYADRGDYDLRAHGEHGDGEFTIFRQFDEPRRVERATVDPDMSVIGPEFGEDAGAVADALSALAEAEPSAFEGPSVTVTVDGTDHTVLTEATGFRVEDRTVAGEHITPHVIEPSFGIDRLLYSVLAHAYREDTIDGETRSYLALPPGIAPTFVGVFPLMARDGLGERARAIAADLRDAGYPVAFDDAGSIGRRYRRQDEIGTPYCVTVDYDSLEDDTVTLRHRDTADQRRVAIDDLPAVLEGLREATVGFGEIGAAVADAG